MVASDMTGIEDIRNRLFEGFVIPAHPLALTANRLLDERRQRALTRYYLAAGAGGLAIGVHTTQFAIHRPEVGLYRPVLELGMGEARRFAGNRPVMIAGIVGETRQAVHEAETARDLGYHCGLVSLGALQKASEDKLIDHVRHVADVLPVFGFYLQPAVGGRRLLYRFWRRFAEIDRVVAIKIAPFNRYDTLDTVRAVADAGRSSDIALYTGNDDNIIADLLTVFPFPGVRIVGGLLGQWAVWTSIAVELLNEVHNRSLDAEPVSAELMVRNAELTDANAALFDPQNGFAGCIPGLHEVLRRQGLMAGRWCLDPSEELSPGQMEEIDRVFRAYPHLRDDSFVREHLDEWLS